MAINLVNKNEPIEEGFLMKLNEFKPFRKEMFKDRLGDKLYMFEQVDKITKDPSIVK